MSSSSLSSSSPSTFPISTKRAWLSFISAESSLTSFFRFEIFLRASDTSLSTFSTLETMRSKFSHLIFSWKSVLSSDAIKPSNSLLVASNLASSSSCLAFRFPTNSSSLEGRGASTSSSNSGNLTLPEDLAAAVCPEISSLATLS